MTSISNRASRPLRVDAALYAFGAAWIVSAIALAVNHLIFLGAAIGPGPGAGLLSLIIQAAAIVLVARRNRAGRLLAVLSALLSALPLPMLGKLFAEHSLFSAAYIGGAFAFKAIAVGLLYTGESKRWFASD